MASNSSKKLDIVMFPWFATGHMTPFLHLSNELANRGHRISMLLPHKAQLQLHHLNLFPQLITFHTVTVPHLDGIPPGTETASEIPLSLNALFFVSFDRTRDQVERALSELKPDFVFYDAAYWIPEIAKKFGIKSVCYNVVSAASLAIALVPARNVPKDRDITMEELSHPPQGYPSSKVVLCGEEAKHLMFISKRAGELSFYERVTTAMSGSDAIGIRTTREMEASFCDYIASQYQKHVLLTGPVLPENADGELEEHYANWLSRFEPGSVVFCAFGSQINLEKAQFHELLLGFELSGYPFLVSLKAPLGSDGLKDEFVQVFQERVKEKGMVITSGWVQQPLILNHKSVGCFVSHCGFGSMWESLMSEKQIVLVPYLGDQVLNTKLLVEELQVAVKVERGEGGWVSKESLSDAIKLVMDEGSEVGAMVKNNHAKWRETGCSAKIMKGYIDGFVEALQACKVNE